MNGINLCLICGVDMGDMNNRQLCCKTYCPKQYEIMDEEPPTFKTVSHPPKKKICHANLPSNTDQSIDVILNSDIFTDMIECQQFKHPIGQEHLMFLRKYQNNLKLYTPKNTCIILMDTLLILQYEVDVFGRPSWLLVRYPFTEPNTPIYEWNSIVYNMLSPANKSLWIRSQDVMYIRIY